MAKTITLTCIQSGFGNIPNSWAPFDPERDERNGDYSRDFIVPEGFSLAENNWGETIFVDRNGSVWMLGGNDAGPWIESTKAPESISLEKAAA